MLWQLRADLNTLKWPSHPADEASTEHPRTVAPSALLSRAPTDMQACDHTPLAGRPPLRPRLLLGWHLMVWACLLLLLLGVEVEAQKVGHDELRPAYHFHPGKHWMNDPNGPMYYQGWYHFFYQYNPINDTWGNIVWAHSVSPDLINWVALDPMMKPSIPSDRFGCWSGSSTILLDGSPVIMYTGINKVVQNEKYQVQNVAYPKNSSDPLLREWVKPDLNPVIVPDGAVNGTKFRDPTTAWHADVLWRLLVGSIEDSLGVAYTYRSKDFKSWTRVRWPLHSATTDSGMWECPDLFPVAVDGRSDGVDMSVVSGAGVKHVLKASLDKWRYDYYTVGRYDKRSELYVPDDPAGDDHHLRYDYGNFYASKTFYDPAKRRRVLWGWANESDTVEDDCAKGWAGIQAIPRKVWLDRSGKQLMQWPVEELETLRGGKPVCLKDRLIKWGEHVEVTGLQTAQADVEVSFEVPSVEGAEALDPALAYDAQKLCSVRGADVVGGVGPFGLWVLASSNLEERTAVFFRIFKAAAGDSNATTPVVLMCTDPTYSSLRPNLYRPTFAGFVDTDIAKGKISLRSLMDRSVVESFGAGGKTCILSRVYPSLATGKNAHLHVFNNGKADIKVSRLIAWEMKPARMNGAQI